MMPRSITNRLLSNYILTKTVIQTPKMLSRNSRKPTIRLEQLQMALVAPEAALDLIDRDPK